MLIWLPGRVTRTHSDKPLTWYDLLAEAFGEMGLHPWEFDRYTYKEFHAKRKGLSDKELREWQRTRLIAYYAAAPHMKKGFKISDIFPLGDEVKKSKPITREEIEQIRNRYKQHGAL